jgi:beta-glucosidase
MSATDRAVQEDARKITWNGKTATSVALLAAAPINLQREANGQLSIGFDYQVGQPPTSNVAARMECGPGCQGAVDLTKVFSKATAGQWSHVRVPLQCFVAAGTRMDTITQPFELNSTGPFELSVANIRLETGTDALLACTP